jgi:SAM-dependent methyltransferase
MHPTTGPAEYDASSLESLQSLENYLAWIRDAFGGDLRGRVLEVGAGTGNYAAAWVDRVDEAVLLEPASAPRARLVERFGAHPRVTIVGGGVAEALAGPLGAPGGALASGSFEVVTLVNVLEHLDDDVGELARLRPLLRRDGALLLLVPALPALYGSLDALVGHRRRYTRAGLGATVRAAGYAIERLEWFDVAGVVPWWLVGRVARARSFDGPLGPLYDRVVVPIMSRVERRHAPPIGKNLLCVARPLVGPATSPEAP